MNCCHLHLNSWQLIYFFFSSFYPGTCFLETIKIGVFSNSFNDELLRTTWNKEFVLTVKVNFWWWEMILQSNSIPQLFMLIFFFRFNIKYRPAIITGQSFMTNLKIWIIFINESAFSALYHTIDIILRSNRTVFSAINDKFDKW